LDPPVFVSYPRFRDAVNGVYDELDYAPPFTMEDGFPWSLYRSIMPRLYLRHFEKGELRADPRQFARWIDADEHQYRAAARTFYDMPAGLVWDLAAIRSNSIPACGIKWRREGGDEAGVDEILDLLGKVPFARLSEGSWRTTVPVPAELDHPSLIFCLRADADASFSLTGIAGPQSQAFAYRWAWQLFAADLPPGYSTVELLIRTSGRAEVIGPVLSSSPISRFR